MNVEAGREIIVLCDGVKLPLARVLCDGISERGAVPLRVVLEDDLTSLPEFVERILDDADVGLVALPSHRMWSAGLSSLLDVGADGPRVRGRCSPNYIELLPLENIARVYASDVASDRAFLVNLKCRLPDGARYHLTAPGGTDLTFTARDWQIHDWEILTSPMEASIDGRIVADASVFFSQVRASISLSIEQGSLVAVDCENESDSVFVQYVRWMDEAFASDPANCQLAEVGFGGNAEARICGIIMEDEAVRGTCHFCFGDNARYGGANSTAWHGGTVVVRDPEITPIT
jgi:leucyl aminopeptidase (aminopeptidase T)